MSKIIAIDGPSASGKSSTARAVARALGYRHLDFGALYRGLALVALRARLARPFDATRVAEAAARQQLALRARGGGYDVVLDGESVEGHIRSAEVTEHVSEIAALRELRTWVNDMIRSQADEDACLVVDGRDIGSVVFPDADLKVFLTAAASTRAERRLLERGNRVDDDWVAREAQSLAARDTADSTRESAPLRQVDDAMLLDTSDLTFEDQVARIVRLARDRGLGPC